jgi:hypothetical protein
LFIASKRKSWKKLNSFFESFRLPAQVAPVVHLRFAHSVPGAFFYIWQLARKGVKQAMENADSMGFMNWIYDSIFHSLGFMMAYKSIIGFINTIIDFIGFIGIYDGIPAGNFTVCE